MRHFISSGCLHPSGELDLNKHQRYEKNGYVQGNLFVYWYHTFLSLQVDSLIFAYPGHTILGVYGRMIDKIRRTYGAFTASYDYRTVSKLVRNTSRAFTLKYCAKTAVYGAILEQNARLRPIYGSLRRSVMIDLGYFL